MAFLNEDIVINSILGPGSSIKGDIKVNGFIRVDGDIDGNLETTGNVIVGQKARIQGNVTAKTITVGGIIKGNITAAESVLLLSTSVVLGDIISRKIKAEENVIVNGHCIALTDDVAFDEACAKWQNMKTINEHSMIKNGHSPLNKINTEASDLPAKESVLSDTN